MRLSPLPRLAAATLLLAPAACDNGNLNMAKVYSSPPAPSVRSPLFDPYAAPGQTPATWVPRVYDRDETIVRLRDPSVEWDFEDYRHAPWLAGRPRSAPPGTF